MIPPRTYELQSWRALGLAQSEAVIEWALAAINAGYDSYSLRILAGLGPPFDELEVRRLYSAACAELGIPSLPVQEHVKCYIGSVLRQMLDRKLSREDAMSRLASLYCNGQRARPPNPFSYGYQLARNFYILANQKEDFNTPSGFDAYWKGDTKSNVDSIIDGEARNWLEAHAKEEEA
jgi:hypothetical protein